MVSTSRWWTPSSAGSTPSKPTASRKPATSPHPCYCIALADVVRIDGFRDTPTAVVPAQTMNSPPISRLECGSEGFRPVCMRHALEVLADRGIGAIAIERRSSAPIARDRSCRTPAARPRSGR